MLLRSRGVVKFEPGGGRKRRNQKSKGWKERGAGGFFLHERFYLVYIGGQVQQVSIKTACRSAYPIIIDPKKKKKIQSQHSIPFIC